MDDRDFGSAEPVRTDAPESYGADVQAHIAAALGVICGFTAISLLLNLLLSQLFGSF